MAVKADFMNEIFELRSEMCDGSNNKNNIYDDNNLGIPKVHSSVL